MKRALALILTLVMCFSLCSCDMFSSKKPSKDDTHTHSTESGNGYIDIPAADFEENTGEDPTEESTEITTETTTTTTVPAHTHSWTKATCAKAKTCTICGITEGKPLSHTWKDATCKTAKTCTVCGKTEGKPLSHTWNKATCTTAKTCSVCGTTEGKAAGHTWKNADCKNPKTCTVCGTTEGDLGDHVWKAATCKDPKTCTVCGKTEGELGDHVWKAATCKDPKTCSVCGTTEGTTAAHTWKDATCTEAKKCSVCGITEGSALGHKWVDATCKSPKKCSVCGQTEGSVSSHTIGSDGSCSVCGYSISSEQYSYLAGNDFRALRTTYTSAVAVGGYVIAYIDSAGNSCVLTYVLYNIGSGQYYTTTLHNLTTKEKITNPYEYYSKVADRYYGQSKIYYMDLASDAIKNERIAMQGVKAMLETGTPSGKGVFVSAKELNS